MMAGVPISMRTEADAGTAGNKIAMMLVSLGTDVDDPRQRLGHGPALDVAVEGADSRRSRPG